MKKSLGPKVLAYPAPVFVVGTYDQHGNPNAMTASWAGICCSNPPCVYVSIRTTRLTYRNIVERKAFTLNIPSEKHIETADYIGMVSGAKTDKFSKCELTAQSSILVDAPLIKEFSLILECSLVHTLEIGVHTQFIGEVMDVKADENILNENGLPDIKKLMPFVYTPENGNYFGIGNFLGKAYSLGKKLI